MKEGDPLDWCGIEKESSIRQAGSRLGNSQQDYTIS
jgi:hypothetical protein